MSKRGRIGPVDEAGDEDLLVLGPALALDEAAGDLARGVVLFVVLDGERDEVQPFLGLRGAAGGGDDGRAAVVREDGAVGLLGHAPGLEDELVIPDSI